jgi:hypothetical protein
VTAPRCRWFDDPGRCPDPVAAPGVDSVPPLSPRHLAVIEPWVRLRSTQPTPAEDWIAWAARRAEAADGERRELGELPRRRRDVQR